MVLLVDSSETAADVDLVHVRHDTTYLLERPRTVLTLGRYIDACSIDRLQRAPFGGFGVLYLLHITAATGLGADTWVLLYASLLQWMLAW